MGKSILGKGDGQGNDAQAGMSWFFWGGMIAPHSSLISPCKTDTRAWEGK